MNLYETMKSHRHLREMAYFSCPVNILRNGEWILGVNSEELVPGDIFEIDCDMELYRVIPCSSVEKFCWMKACWRGEYPVVRKSIPADEKLSDNLENKSSILYAGTKLMRVRGGNSRRAIGMVIRTSFDTFQGFWFVKLSSHRRSNSNSTKIPSLHFLHDNYCLWRHRLHLYCIFTSTEEKTFKKVFLSCSDLHGRCTPGPANCPDCGNHPGYSPLEMA